MQKLQKLQGQNEDIYQNSKLLGKSPSRNYRNYRVKKNIPPEFFDSSWPRLHTAQQKYTHIKNLKLPRRSYRNYRVKRNAYIEILNCLVSLPADTTKTTAYKWTYPPEFSDFHWLRLYTTQWKIQTCKKIQRVLKAPRAAITSLYARILLTF